MRAVSLLLLSLSTLALSCGPKAPPASPEVPAVEQGSAAVQSQGDEELTEADWGYLLEPWEGPYGGVPPLDRVKTEHFAPAIRRAMELHLTQVNGIAKSLATPSFQEVVVPLELSGRELQRATTIFGIFASSYSTPELREVQAALAPELAAHRSALFQNELLYKRLKLVAREDLDTAERRLVDSLLLSFQRAGAGLDEAQRERVAQINQELSTLYNQFSDNLLADEEGYVLYLTEESQLDGLPDNVAAAAAAAAEERGHPGEWAITNTRSSMDPFLTFSTDRELRKKVWTTYYSRGDNGGEHDNNELITRILQLRHERATLLGFDSHADYQLQDRMAKTPERAIELMEKVWPAAKAKFAAEVARMQAVADAEGADLTIEPWDVRFYAEKVRKAEYDLDTTELQAYLQLDKLREGMFWAVGELYGWSFEPVDDVPVPHEDVSVWKVLNADGSLRGLWYFDPYARQGKRSGAWMNAYREQERIEEDIVPLVSNNSNFVKGAPGEPVLISWDDAETLFHEFGHAIHGLASDVNFPSQAGTSVARDYVEFPSQLNEHWLSTPELLKTYAVHHETGEPLPQELLDRLEEASNAAQGFYTVEYLGSALIDMKLHQAGGDPIDPDAFEREELEKLGMPPQVVMRHRTPQFAHIFSGDGYSAGYYSYLWSDTLTADVANAFVEAGSFYDEATAQRLFDTILSVGDTVDPADAFRNFRGRDPQVDALLEERGLVD
jgi:peptidyl-dipeptidase Dcp